MAGFFPVMIFGLPAGCLAMYHSARPERRAEVGGVLLSLALTAALTGVTEPIEFSFMFLAPALFALHAVLTGIAMVIMDAARQTRFRLLRRAVRLWAELRPRHPPAAPAAGRRYYAGLYYGLFRRFILRFDLQTPGREPLVAPPASDPAVRSDTRAADYLAALGGPGNLAAIDACTTRLRLVVRDQGAIDGPRLKAIGARGVIQVSATGLQVIIGPIADQLARELSDEARHAPSSALGSGDPSAPFIAMPDPVAASFTESTDYTSLAPALLKALAAPPISWA